MPSGDLKEKNRIKSQKYREKHREKVRAYDRERWKLKKAEASRVKAMGNKMCRVCEIRLAGRYGGFGTKYYCRSCVDRGLAHKHSLREATRRWRLKNKEIKCSK